jgi:hypothetical protein
MIQILYTADHLNRAQALSAQIPGSRHRFINVVPSVVPNLDTLVFWGHGTFVSLCDLDVDQLTKLITEWKKLNSGIKNIEIITCNARHFPGGHDSFANRLKSKLHSGFMSSTRNLVVKALPTNVGGALNAFSILLADYATNSWCYITAPGPNDNAMMAASNLVKKEAKPFGDDVAQACNKIVSTVHQRNYTLNYGYFNRLRDNLVAV